MKIPYADRTRLEWPKYRRFFFPMHRFAVNVAGFLRIRCLVDRLRLKFVHRNGLNLSRSNLCVLVDSTDLRMMWVKRLMCKDSAILAWNLNFLFSHKNKKYLVRWNWPVCSWENFEIFSFFDSAAAVADLTLWKRTIRRASILIENFFQKFSKKLLKKFLKIFWNKTDFPNECNKCTKL